MMGSSVIFPACKCKEVLCPFFFFLIFGLEALLGCLDEVEKMRVEKMPRISYNEKRVKFSINSTL